MRCPACLGRVALRRRRFAHVGRGRACPPPAEGWFHSSAKHVVALGVRRFARGIAPAPRIARRCARCGVTRWQPLPSSVHDAIVEGELRGLRCDVVLVDEVRRPLLAVEVMNRCPLDDVRRERLADLPWIELRATEVMQAPGEWRPMRGGNLRPWRCVCEDALHGEVSRSPS